MVGIIKTGTHTPPKAANTTTKVAPNGAACSCDLATVPSNKPNPTAANPENKATINAGNNFPETLKVGNSNTGKR